ncbi:MAG: uncharacterized protein A8A55_1791, partial [Amphiamblys sp. WSBS2006]
LLITLEKIDVFSYSAEDLLKYVKKQKQPLTEEQKQPPAKKGRPESDGLEKTLALFKEKIQQNTPWDFFASSPKEKKETRKRKSSLAQSLKRYRNMFVDKKLIGMIESIKHKTAWTSTKKLDLTQKTLLLNGVGNEIVLSSQKIVLFFR